MKVSSSSIFALALLLVSSAPVYCAVKKSITTQQDLSSTKKQGNVILKYTASWCPACQMIKKDFEKLTNDYPAIYMAEVDVSANPDLATNNGVEGLPTFVFYKNGSEVDKVVGAPADFHGEMGQKIRNYFGSTGEKKKETNGNGITEPIISTVEEEQIITEPMQNMPEEVDNNQGLFGHVINLIGSIIGAIKNLIMGIIDWFRRLLGL